MASLFPQGLQIDQGMKYLADQLQGQIDRKKAAEAYQTFSDATNPEQTVPAPTGTFTPDYSQVTQRALGRLATEAQPTALAPTGELTPAPLQMAGSPRLPENPVPIRGAETRERQPISPFSPQYQQAQSQYMASSPNAIPMMQAAAEAAKQYQEKPVSLSAQEQLYGVTQQPNTGQENVRRLAENQNRPAPAKQVSIVRDVDGVPHKIVQSLNVQGQPTGEEIDMGIDYEAASRRQRAQNAGRGGSAQPLSPQTVTTMAEDYLMRNTLPPMGMGNTSQRMQIYEEMNRLAQSYGLDAQARVQLSSAVKAEMGNIQNLTKMQGAVLQFENTAQKNLKLALERSGLVDRFTAPVFNKWKLYVQKQFGGDAETADFEAAVRVAANEIAKVTATTTGNLVPQQEREEYNKLMDTALNMEQFKSVADILARDMENRKQSFREELTTARNSIPTLSTFSKTGVVAPPPPVGGPMAAPPGAAAPAGVPPTEPPKKIKFRLK